MVNPRFCKEFIEIMEEYGQWSDGTNKVRETSICVNSLVYIRTYACLDGDGGRGGVQEKGTDENIWT
jgi:hypothetical protein